MPDFTPVAPPRQRFESTKATRPLARRTMLAAAIFCIGLAIALWFDVLHTPERSAAAGIILLTNLGLSTVIVLLAAVAPRWIRVTIGMLAPLTLMSLGIYTALVGASLASCTLALCACVTAAALLDPGPGVHVVLLLGAAAGYAIATTVASATLPTMVVFAAVGALTTIASVVRQRRQAGVRVEHGTFERAAAERDRATTLLSAVKAFAANTADVPTLARLATEHACQALDADWCILLHRIDTRPYRIIAVSGLPPQIAASLQDHVLDPDRFAAIHERVVRQPAVALAEREAQRLLPLDSLAPILKHAIAAALHEDQRAAGILLAGYATRRGIPHHAESILAGLAEQLEIALVTARRIESERNANHAKSEFISMMSHELRTPINVVMGYADLLIEGAFGEASLDQLDVLNRVRHQAAQLLDMVQPMLDLNRLEARQTAVVREPFRIGDLLDNLRMTVPASWCKPGVHLVWGEPVGPSVVLHSDQGKLEAIVRNLIHNALKYTDHGHVRVDVDTTSPGIVRIAVRDTGTGIAAADLSSVFEMFAQSSADVPRDGGVGLGLYIVKRLTDVLGGSVHVESQRGVGSTFTVTLPLEAPAEPA